MPPKNKSTLERGKKKSKAKSGPPETENEFLEEADEFEKAGGKWKAGDTAKALRFYYRAIATYEDALKKFPVSFDLAYNKAHLQYEMTQDPKISPSLGPPIKLLEETLVSHRYALNLDQSNADILFNTAQVLSSLAEKLIETKAEDAQSHSVAMLQEAVELFASCLTRQEMEFTEFQELTMQADQNQSVEDQEMDIDDAAPGDESSNGDANEEWAAVVEPITPHTLVETALAELSSLTTLISISAPTESSSLAAISELGTTLVQEKLSYYITLLPSELPNAEGEAEHSKFLSLRSASIEHNEPTHLLNPQDAASEETTTAYSLFSAALADAEFRSRLSSRQDYISRLHDIFDSKANGENPTASFLCAYADALMDSSSALGELSSEQDGTEAATQAWNAITLADSLLARALKILASSLPSAESSPPEKSKIYLLRGDIELQRRCLALLPSASSSIAGSVGTLVKNAGVYYRGATGLAAKEGDVETKAEANIKTKIVDAIDANRAIVMEGLDAVKVRAILDEMLEEGLLDEASKQYLL